MATPYPRGGSRWPLKQFAKVICNGVGIITTGFVFFIVCLLLSEVLVVKKRLGLFGRGCWRWTPVADFLAWQLSVCVSCTRFCFTFLQCLLCDMRVNVGLCKVRTCTLVWNEPLRSVASRNKCGNDSCTRFWRMLPPQVLEAALPTCPPPPRRLVTTCSCWS